MCTSQKKIMKTVIDLGKKNVFYHENMAYKKKTPSPEWTVSLKYMAAVLPIACDGHLRRNTLLNLESAFARLVTSKPPLRLTYCCCCAVSVRCLAPRPDINFSIIDTTGTCQVRSNGEVESKLLERLTFICSVCRWAWRCCKCYYHEHFLFCSWLCVAITFA